MSKKHDIDQRRQLPEEHGSRETEDHRARIEEGGRNGDRNERHHAGLARPEFVVDPLEERPAAVEINHRRKTKEKIRLSPKGKTLAQAEQVLCKRRKSEDRNGENH